MGRSTHRAVGLAVAGLLSIGGPTGSSASLAWGQETTSPDSGHPVADSSMANRIQAAWSEIRALQRAGKTAEAQALLGRYADELFADYLSRPETLHGQQALTTAFRMWGNAEADRAIEQALSRIDRGGRLWAHLLENSRPAFAAKDRLDDYRTFVAELAPRLTDLENRSEVWMLLAREYRAAGEPALARDCYLEIVELGMQPMLVQAAEAALHELDVLGVGRPAPAFTVVDLEGAQQQLARLRGKVVLLEFWSTTCAPCIPELDSLKKIRRRFPEERLAMLGVALDTDAAAVQRVIDSKELDWPQVCDGAGFAGPLPGLYNVRGLPRSFLIDRQGLIAGKDLRGEKLSVAIRDLFTAPEATSAVEPPSPSGP